MYRFYSIVYFMDEFEPILSYGPEDQLTPAEYHAREEALHALIADAAELQDTNRLGIFEQALGALNRENPGKGAYHSVNTCPEISPSNHLTPEQARTVELSMNPFKRLGQLASYGSAFHLKKSGMSPLPLYMTRRDLVRVARARQSAERTMAILASLPADEINP